LTEDRPKPDFAADAEKSTSAPPSRPDKEGANKSHQELKTNELEIETAALFFAPLRNSIRIPSANTTAPPSATSTILCWESCAASAPPAPVGSFLRHHADHGGRQENPDLFFKAPKSKPRLENLVSLNDRHAAVMSERIADPLAGLGELYRRLMGLALERKRGRAEVAGHREGQASDILIRLRRILGNA